MAQKPPSLLKQANLGLWAEPKQQLADVAHAENEKKNKKKTPKFTIQTYNKLLAATPVESVRK